MSRLARVAGLAALTLALLTLPVLAADDTPLSTTSEIPIGISLENKAFVAIQEKSRGTKTVFDAVAFRAPKWRSSRLRTRNFEIDATDDETEAASRERAEPRRRAMDDLLAAKGFVQATPVRGANTGRYRVPELGLTVFVEDDKLIARTGMLTMKSQELLDSVTRLVGRCRGKASGRILHVVANPEWRAVGVYLEASCEPETEGGLSSRVRKMVVADISGILQD